jgi:ATPase family protein associated with various cellular activities (AAA)
VHNQDETPDKVEFHFPPLKSRPGTVSLRTVIGTYLSCPHASRATADKIFHILPRLRCLQHALGKYNAGLADSSAAFDQYWRRHTLDLLSGFGFLPGSAPGSIRIAGLDDLIVRIEAIHRDTIQEARSLIAKGQTSFSALGELFRPDTPVQASILSGTTTCAFRVTDAFFEERRNLLGSQKIFHVTLEVVAPLGDHFSIASFSEVISAWNGVRTRSLADFSYRPVPDAERHSLQSRAEDVVRYGLGGAKYLAYSPGSFFLHHTRPRQNGAVMSMATSGAQSLTGGRIMVDMARGASLGHHPCQGVDEATLAIIQLAGRYRQWMSKRRIQSEPPGNDALVLWDQVPDEFVMMCWPALVGFSFTAKAWGHVLVDGLSPIDFQDQAFDRLVLSQERKQLIRAVVRSGTGTGSTPQTQDLIGGKQGGLIFLLHGPPGVGKTLTAEAIAEVLHRPLYYVTMGELGVTPDDLEARLTDVMDLCAEWNALAVLDEADVFLETRSSSDLVRNAMVCVMLRILEYHPGILFLTTNRVRSLDPAFESRITLAMRFEALSRSARAQVWRSQLDGVAGASDIDCDELAAQDLNGRQIKNAVRLALSLAVDQGVVLTQSTLLRTVELTSLGRQNMVDDGTWEDLVDK